jgi:adenylate cyclase
MVRPFRNGMLAQACPMADVLGELTNQLVELAALREQADFAMAPS